MLQASDYFDQLFEWAVKLIKDGKAYVCDLNAEQIAEYRGLTPADRLLDVRRIRVQRLDCTAEHVFEVGHRLGADV